MRKYQPLSFQEYREHLFANCGYQRNSSGLKLHKAYAEHCNFMREINAKYPE